MKIPFEPFTLFDQIYVIVKLYTSSLGAFEVG